MVLKNLTAKQALVQKIGKIMAKSNKLYQIKIPTIKNNIELYFEKKLIKSQDIKKINKKFFKNSYIYYNNEKVSHLNNQLKFLKIFF